MYLRLLVCAVAVVALGHALAGRAAVTLPPASLGDAECSAAQPDVGDPVGLVNARTGCGSVRFSIGALTLVFDDHGPAHTGIAGQRTRLELFDDSVLLAGSVLTYSTAWGDKRFAFDSLAGRYVPDASAGFAPDGHEFACQAGGCTLLDAGVPRLRFETLRGGRFYLTAIEEYGGPTTAPGVVNSVQITRLPGQVHPVAISENRGWTTQLSYDASGTLWRVRDAFGRESTLTYDSGPGGARRLVRVDHPGPEGNTLSQHLAWNAANLLRAWAGPDLTGVRLDRSPGGRVVGLVDIVASLGGGEIATERERAVVQFAYGLARPGYTGSVTEMRGPYSQTQAFGFEHVAGRPRVTLTQDEVGFVATYRHDGAQAGRLQQVLHDDGTGFAYDYSGQRLAAVDRLELGGLRRRMWTASAWHHGWVPAAWTDALTGEHHTRTFDAINRPLTGSDGTNTWAFTRSAEGDGTRVTFTQNGVVQGDLRQDVRGDTVELAVGAGAARRVVTTLTREAPSGLVTQVGLLNGVVRAYSGRDSNPFRLATAIGETGMPATHMTFNDWGQMLTWTRAAHTLSYTYTPLGEPSGGSIGGAAAVAAVPGQQAVTVTWSEGRPVAWSLNGSDCAGCTYVDAPTPSPGPSPVPSPTPTPSVFPSVPPSLPVAPARR